MNRQLQWTVAALAAVLILLMGCGNWALVHREQFCETHENFKTYRAHVAPTCEPEKVNELADLIEQWFETWKEGYNAPESRRSD